MTSEIKRCGILFPHVIVPVYSKLTAIVAIYVAHVVLRFGNVLKWTIALGFVKAVKEEQWMHFNRSAASVIGVSGSNAGCVKIRSGGTPLFVVGVLGHSPRRLPIQRASREYERPFESLLADAIGLLRYFARRVCSKTEAYHGA